MLSDNEGYIMEVDSVSKHYGSRRILSGVYLQVKTGDICALFGRNGMGKSTLMRIIFGTLRPDFKFIRIGDKYLKDPYKIPSLITYLLDEPFLPKELKVKTILKSYNLPVDMSDEIIRNIFNKRISQISSGENRYLELLVTLSTDSRFILLDEPFNFLSPLMVEKIEELIVSKSKYKGIIIADHRYRNLLNIANRILLIKDQSLYELEDEKDLVYEGYLV